MPPCTMPIRSWSRRPCASLQAAAHRVVRSTAASSSGRGSVPGAHWSNAMMMSAPSSSWMRIASSGVNTWREPSYTERNSTPSSLITRVSSRLNTWKPPESVRIGPSQRMNPCRPPCAAMISVPGRKYRW